MNNYRNKINGVIAVYDSFMGLWYIEGHKFEDGPMIPLSKHELENSDEWEEII